MRRVPVLLLASCALGACAGDLPGLAPTDVPTAFEQPVAMDAPIWPDADWWRRFGSTELDALVAAVQTNNLDLAAAEARVLQADARVRETGSSLLPSISLSGDAGRSVQAALSDAPTRSNSFGLSAGASYELDFWGANRNALSSARASRKASQADRETVALTAVSGAASTYFQLLSLREQLATARENLAAAENIYAITQSRVRNGVASPLEEAQQLATLAGQRASIPQLDQQFLQARAALAVLLGLPPEGFDVAGQDLSAIATPQVAPGLPSELLARRPDIVAAEASLIGAHADLAVARAAFFPSIGLTANGGVQSAALATLFNASTFGYGFGASIAQTIFDGGRLIAQSDAAEARRQEILANYRSTVINAFSEVEIALGDVVHLALQEELQLEQVTQSERAFRIAEARYREGVEAYLTVLDAQRSLYSARNQYSQTKLARLQALVTLFRTLGGGWRDSDALPQTATR